MTCATRAPDALTPAIRRHDDGSIDFGFYRAEAFRLASRGDA